MAEKLCQLKKKGGASSCETSIYGLYLHSSVNVGYANYSIFDSENDVINTIDITGQTVTLPDGTIINNSVRNDTYITAPTGKSVYVKTLNSQQVGTYGTTADPDGVYSSTSWHCHFGGSYPFIDLMIAIF